MVRTLPQNTTCWWCGKGIERPLYAIKFFSYAYQRVRMRVVCHRCWYSDANRFADRAVQR